MNCYIVRIYRQEANKPGEIVGIVEEVGASGKRAFTNIEELWEILNPDRVTDSREKGRERGKGKSDE